MNPGKFSVHFKSKGHSFWVEMLVFIVALVASILVFTQTSLQPFSPLPLLAVAAWLIMPRLGSRSDQIIFLAFFILCYFIDDVAFGPWNEVNSITEVLGVLLFKSIGITGFEAFGLGFSCLCLIISSREEKQLWLRLGLFPLMVLASLILVSSLFASAYGLVGGGLPATALTQIRFLYLMPVWTFIGFVVMRDEQIFRKIFFWLTIVMVFKSLQTIFIWGTNRALFAEAEYVYEHFFSAYLVVAMVHLLQYAWKRKEIFLKLLSLVGFFSVFAAYALNDRRTSYVGIPFAMIILLFFLPRSFMKRYGRRIVAASLGLGVLTAVTWPLPVGLGAIYRSFGQEEGTGGPSYRDLENANLLREVARAPLMGMGFGKEFDEVYPMPSVATVYPNYKKIPHNNLLYSWCYGGPMTIAALSLVFMFMIAIAGRLIYDEDLVGYRYIGIVALFFFVQFFSYVFGDLGLQVSKIHLLGGLFLGGCFRLYRQRKKELGKC